MDTFIINKRSIEDNRVENSNIIINSAKKPKVIRNYNDYLSYWVF